MTMHKQTTHNHTNRTQLQTLMAHLCSYDPVSRKRRTISQMEALGLYRMCSLSSRICQLKKAHPTLKIVKTLKVDQTGKRYMRYGVEG